MRSTRLDRFSIWMGHSVPDALTASVVFLFIVAAAALLIGTPLSSVVDAYYRGLWMLLPFTMQMTLIIVLGSVLSASSAVRRLVVSVSRLPKSPAGVAAVGGSVPDRSVAVSVTPFCPWRVAASDECAELVWEVHGAFIESPRTDFAQSLT